MFGITSKNFQANYQNRWLNYQNHWCGGPVFGLLKPATVFMTLVNTIGVVSPMTKLLALVVEWYLWWSNSTLVTKVVALATGLPAPIAQPIELVTYPQMGWRKSLCVFVKYFTNFLKVKHFTAFYKRFYINGKYFTSLTTFYMKNKIGKSFSKNHFTPKQTKYTYILFHTCLHLTINRGTTGILHLRGGGIMYL